MSKMLKSVVVSLAVLLAFSSCGKNKELKTPEGSGTEAPKADPAPTGSVDSAPVKKQPADEKNPNDGTDGGPIEVTVQEGNGQNQNQNGDQAKSGSRGNRGNRGGEQSDDTVSGQGKSGSPFGKPSGNKLTAIDFNSMVADKTGGKANDLFYTGAGQDGLMNSFKATALTVPAAQQALNSKLAKAVVGARLSKAGGQDLSIDLAIDETINGQGGVKNYRLKATAEGDLMRLSASSSSGALAFQGGYLKCLDLDGSCSNAYAKIKMSGAYTRVIFRKSYADTFYLYQTGIVGNAGYDLLKSYVLNRKNNAATSQKIDGVEVSSYEVTNGRGAMGVQITTQDNEMVGLNVPLLVSGNASIVDAAVSKSADISKSYDLASSAGYSSRLSQAISDARIVANNGQGQMKLKLNFQGASGGGSIWVILSKVPTATMSLADVAAFEKTVKFF